MKYQIKGTPGATVVVLDENTEVLSLLVTRDYDGYKEHKKETMKKEMFEMCLRTGYITPEEAAVAV
ncbi:hypothetical protein [Spirochaeta isovalerica]|uniref:Uncharacterized protein n=1 Tax=Spirochaeta isovalerica TaxID=150 RepID=A0A841RDG5_9SPIO|nr:hypothetical protein [Spirochaeta isovalerica]MBB6482013.1 hypothetical protein [Spirochaeta isovalerica]